MKNRSLFLLVISAILVSTGMFISYYGSEKLTHNLATIEKEVNAGNSVEITKELKPDEGKIGVYVVQMIDSKEDSDPIRFSLYDPFNTEVSKKTLETDSIEKKFEVSSEGKHRLVIENTGQYTVRIAGALGYMPTSESFWLSIIGVVTIMAGLVGLTIGLIYFLRPHKIRGQD